MRHKKTSFDAPLTVELLLAQDHQSSLEREQTRQQVGSLALDLQRVSASSTRLLESSFRQISARSADESSIALSLAKLREQIELIDPSSLNLQDTWLRQLFRWLFGIEAPLTRFLIRYQLTRDTIEETLLALSEGQEELRRDTITLAADQEDLNQTNEKLTAVIADVGRLKDQLTAAREKEQNQERAQFIDQDILFPLHQRALDLQQQLVVSQQAVLALDLLIQNNQDLIRGVDQALYTTSSGLRIATSVAATLAEQNDISNSVGSTAKAANALLEGVTAIAKNTRTSAEGRTSAAQVDIEGINHALTEIRKTVDEVESYRVKSVPAIAASIEKIAAPTQNVTNGMDPDMPHIKGN